MLTTLWGCSLISRYLPFPAERRESPLPPALIGAWQPPHREFDLAAGQFTPAFNPAHIGGLGIAGQEISRFAARLVARQREGLAQITVAALAAPGHAVCQIARARDHVATPTDNDLLNIAPVRTNPSPRPWWKTKLETPKLSRLSDIKSVQ